jgi:ribosomal protein L32
MTVRTVKRSVMMENAMATCAKCGNDKLTERPCPKCGGVKNK